MHYIDQQLQSNIDSNISAMEQDLKRICQTIIKHKKKPQIRAQQLSGQYQQKSIGELTKLLKINDKIHNIIDFERVINKDNNQQLTKSSYKKHQQIRVDRISQRRSNVVHFPNINDITIDSLKSKQKNQVKPNNVLNEGKQKIQRVVLGPQYQKLIDQYIQKIKQQDLLIKYGSKEALIKDACQHINKQLIQKQLNKTKKNSKSTIMNPYKIQDISNRKQVISVPTFFRKSKRRNYGSISQVTLMHDLQNIKKTQFLQAKNRQRQQRIFLHKMRAHKLIKQKNVRWDPISDEIDEGH